MVSQARSENGSIDLGQLWKQVWQKFLLGQDLESRGHTITSNFEDYSYQGCTDGKTLCHWYIAIHLSTYQSLQTHSSTNIHALAEVTS